MGEGYKAMTPRGHAGAIYLTRKGDQVPASSNVEGVPKLTQASIGNDGENALDPATSIIYFSIIGNHLAYFSQSPKADFRLATFFNWLLKDRTKVIDNFYTLELRATLNTDVKEHIAKHGIKEISLNSNTAINFCDGIMDVIIQAIMGNPQNVSSTIKYNESNREMLLRACSCSLKISTGLKDRGLKQEALGYYISKLSDEEIAELQLTLGDGSQVKQGEITKSGNIDIEYKFGVASPYSSKRALTAWLENNIN